MGKIQIKRLFRYFDEKYGLLALKDLEIKCSEPNNLNDPFEFSPKVKIQPIVYEKARRMIMEKFPYSTYLPEFILPSEGLRRQSYERFIQGKFEEIKTHYPQNMEDVEKKFADIFNDYWQIICFSEEHRSTLMWSHYSNKHKGMVIEFNLNDSVFKGLLTDGDIKKVMYRKFRREYIHDFRRGKNFTKQILEVAFTKAHYWKYEKEVRLALAKKDIPSIGLYIKKVQEHDTINKFYFLKLNRSVIKNIYIGIRFEKLNELMETINNSQLKCGIYQERLNKRIFKMSFRKLYPIN